MVAVQLFWYDLVKVTGTQTPFDFVVIKYHVFHRFSVLTAVNVHSLRILLNLMIMQTNYINLWVFFGADY